MKRIWARILVSLIIGGGTQEFVRIYSGKNIGLVFFIVAVVSFVLISVGVYLYGMIQLQRKVDRELHVNDDLIDDTK